MTDDRDERAVRGEGVGDGDARLRVTLIVARDSRELDSRGFDISALVCLLNGELHATLDTETLRNGTCGQRSTVPILMTFSPLVPVEPPLAPHPPSTIVASASATTAPPATNFRTRMFPPDVRLDNPVADACVRAVKLGEAYDTQGHA